MPIPPTEYFDKLALQGIVLDDEQKSWYVAKQKLMGEDMLREFPSTFEEAFQASQEGFWFASDIKALQDSGHITNVSYDAALTVHTAWDLGQADFTAIWFAQVTRSGDVNVIDYEERRDTPLSLWYQILKDRGYSYGTHIWPHDAKARDRAGITFVQQAAALGLYGVVLEQHGIRDGINLVKSKFPKMWFDGRKCRIGINVLTNYKKRYSTAIAGYTGEEVHDDSSHGAAAMRYLCAGLPLITQESDNNSKALRAYWG